MGVVCGACAILSCNRGGDRVGEAWDWCVCVLKSDCILSCSPYRMLVVVLYTTSTAVLSV